MTNWLKIKIEFEITEESLEYPRPITSPVEYKCTITEKLNGNKFYGYGISHYVSRKEAKKALEKYILKEFGSDYFKYGLQLNRNEYFRYIMS